MVIVITLFCLTISLILFGFTPLNKNMKFMLIFFHFSAFVKTQFERDIKYFQCDMGREFDNSSFKSFCQNHGMVFRFSCPQTSPQNGKV